MKLIELEDLFWLPTWYRDLMTDCLEKLSSISGAYKQTTPLVERLLLHTKKRELIDFGSGAGGPVIHTIAGELQKSFPGIRITLTDLFPNMQAAAKFNRRSAAITYRTDSINMTAPPKDLEGARTMFTSFHHLSNLQAAKVLQNAARTKTPIGVFEVTGRSLPHFAMVLLVPFLVLLITPFIKERRFLRIFFTYIVPIVPIGCLWDGVISNFKTRSQSQLQRLIKVIEPVPNFRFELGSFHIIGPLMGTFLLGLPDAAEV